MELMQILQGWQQAGWIRALDLQFARFLATQQPIESPWVLWLAALTSHQLGRGHPCLDLELLWQQPNQYLELPPAHTVAAAPQLPTPAELLAATDIEQLRVALSGAASCARTQHAPLAWVAQQRLYLRRYWRYEQQIKADLQARMQRQRSLDPKQLAPLLQRLFGRSTERFSWQQLACAVALRSGFSIITGGPGTGKTYTVVRLLAALLASQTKPRPLQIKLAAPTGKAAARMSSAIAAELGQLLTIEPRLADIDVQAVTLHRLLGSQPRTRRFKHHAAQPLPADVVIVDEASMIDIEMMAALLEALPSHCQLIMLGDKDQLASVGAGAILGQLCRQAECGNYHPEVAQWLAHAVGQPLPGEVTRYDPSLPAAAYHQHTVMLRESRRFDASQGIGKLAHEINLQQCDWLQRWLADSAAMTTADESLANIAYWQPSSLQAPHYQRRLVALYQPLLALLGTAPTHPEQADHYALQVLQQLSQVQLLCAVNEGPWGTTAVNQLLQRWLHPQQAGQTWYHGRPVLIERNDYGLNVRNGDLGVALQLAPDQPLRVAFADGDGVRWLLPSRLPSCESAYAMTVHKSQGSEFAHVLVLLPDYDVPVLCKELLYTAVTRARQQVTLIAAQPALVLRTVQRRIDRIGGLIASGEEA